MFTGSAQHAAVNFGQYDYYGYIPNATSTLLRPPPTVKGVSDLQVLLDTLPEAGDSSQQIALMHLLSQFSSNEVSTIVINIHAC